MVCKPFFSPDVSAPPTAVLPPGVPAETCPVITLPNVPADLFDGGEVFQGVDLVLIDKAEEMCCD